MVDIFDISFTRVRCMWELVGEMTDIRQTMPNFWRNVAVTSDQLSQWNISGGSAADRAVFNAMISSGG